MKPYQNLAGDSGVLAYETGGDYIRIKFRGNEVYLYTNAVTGQRHVAEMKRLAAKGKGLSTYISQHVKDRYAEKLQ